MKIAIAMAMMLTACGVEDAATPAAAVADAASGNERGETGQRGEKGDKGERGERGEKGDNGEQGAGERGEAGMAGAAGADGAVGERGERGEQGQRGEQGAAGATGAAGAPAPFSRVIDADGIELGSVFQKVNDILFIVGANKTRFSVNRITGALQVLRVHYAAPGCTGDARVELSTAPINMGAAPGGGFIRAVGKKVALSTASYDWGGGCTAGSSPTVSPEFYAFEAYALPFPYPVANPQMEN